MRAASSGKFPSFVDALLFHAVKAPQSPAVGFEAGVITYGQLAQAIFSATARCQKAGLRPGSTVALIVNDPVWHICLIAALYRLGIVSVSLAPAELPIFAGDTLAAVLHDAPLPVGHVAKTTTVTADWFTDGTSTGRGARSPFAPTDLCYIGLSSGTTGQPKPVAFNSEIIWDRLTTHAMRGRFGASERIYCGPQLRAVFGFVVAFTALVFGKMICFSDNAGTAIPVMSFYKADLAVLTVFQLLGVVEVQEKNFGGLDGLREIQAGGSVVSEELFRRTRGCMGVSLIGAYGSTEAGVTAYAPIESFAEARAEGAVGFIAPWAYVDVCDEQENALPQGQDGIIRIRGIGLAPAYEPKMTRVTSPDAFFPGDYGRVMNNGMLAIAGRTLELINIGGNKIAPERFENIILQCKGVKDAAVFSVDIKSALPQVWAAIVADKETDIAEVIKRCAETPMIGAPAVVRMVGSIPRSKTGKIMRDELRKELTGRGS